MVALGSSKRISTSGSLKKKKRQQQTQYQEVSLFVSQSGLAGCRARRLYCMLRFFLRLGLVGITLLHTARLHAVL